MIYQLVQDMIDLARFRVRPLTEYHYPGWQIMSVVTLIGLFAAASASDIQASVPARIVFFVMLKWLELSLMSWFFNWWMRQGENWDGEGEILPLLVASSGINLLAPLLSWFPDGVAQLLAIGMSAYGVLVLVQALSLATGARRGHVIGGVLLFLPMAVACYLVAITFAVQVDWIALADK